MWPDEIQSLIYNFYVSVAAGKIVWADLYLSCALHIAGALGDQQTRNSLKG